MLTKKHTVFYATHDAFCVNKKWLFVVETLVSWVLTIRCSEHCWISD